MKLIKKFYKIVFGYKEKLYFFLLIIASILNFFVEFLSLGLILPLIGLLVNPSSFIESVINFFPKLIFIKDYINLNDPHFIYYFLGVFVVLFLLKNLYSVVFFYFQCSFSQQIEAKLSNMIFKKYSYQNFNFFINNHSSKLVSRIHNDVIIASRSFTSALITVFSELILVLGFLLIVLYLKLFDVFIIFLIFGLFALSILKILSIYTKRWGKLTKEANAGKLYTINSFLQNIKNIIIDNKFESIISEFKIEVRKLASLQKKIITTNIFPRTFFEIFGILSITIIIIYLTNKNVSSDQIVIVTGFFVTIAYRLIPSFQKIIGSYSSISFSKTMLKSVLEELELDEYLNHSKNKKNFNKSIKLQNISHYYLDKSKLIFDKINIEIEKGDLVGLFGPSGVGKSTLIDIISCLKKPTEGFIFVDNQKIFNAEEIREWQNNISYVSQNSVLIKDTIKNNIIYSRQDEKFDQKLFNEVLEKTELINLTNSLPQKIDSQLGELGSKISGGQKQRICIARALYKQPKFIIFDEATNALDNETEEKIIQTILSLKKQMTIIIVSHKMNIINKCDKIFEIKNKKIFEIKNKKIFQK